jgi:hypothetical protein
MFEANGTAESRPGVLRLGDLVAETKPVVVMRDGREVALRAYVWGRRIPRGIEARVSQAYQEFPKTIEAKVDPETHEVVLDEATGQPVTETKFEMADYSEMLTRVACTLVEGLSPIEAEVMTFAEIRELLTYLEYLKPAETQPERPLAGPTMETPTTGASSASDSPSATDLVGVSS